MKKASSNKNNGTAKWLIPVAAGMIAGTIAILLLLLVFALIMSFKDIPQSFIPTMSVAAMASGGFLSGFVAARSARERGLIIGLVCGAIISIIVLVAGIVILKDSIGGLAYTKFLISLASAAIGGVLGVNGKHRR